MDDPWKFGASWPCEGYLEIVHKRARLQRWASLGMGKVICPGYGAVVVPMSSKLSAIMNAAEVWGCRWSTITDADVVRPEPGERPVPMPVRV